MAYISSHVYVHRCKKTVVRTVYGNSECFEVKVGLPSVLWCYWLGGRKGIQSVKTEWWSAGVVICMGRGADLHMVQFSWCHGHYFLLQWVQISFTFLVLAHSGNPGQRAIKWVLLLFICTKVQPWVHCYLWLSWKPYFENSEFLTIGVVCWWLGCDSWNWIWSNKKHSKWKVNVKNRGMKVNMNETKVMINGECQMVKQKAARWSWGVWVQVLVVIQYSVLIVRTGYTRSVVV